jgi:hypothetical protein
VYVISDATGTVGGNETDLLIGGGVPQSVTDVLMETTTGHRDLQAGCRRRALVRRFGSARQITQLRRKFSAPVLHTLDPP